MNDDINGNRLTSFLVSSNKQEVKWKKMRNRDAEKAENLLRSIEDDYVSACSRFLVRKNFNSRIWMLCAKNREVTALLISCGSTLSPVLCGRKEIPREAALEVPQPRSIYSFLKNNKIHSVQGLKNEVIIFENMFEKAGKVIADSYDYDLMTLDTLPMEDGFSAGPEKLILKPARMTDLDSIAPLQASYEMEEVLPKGSVFSPAASRVNIANIVAEGKVLTAELNGRMVGKINVSGAAFTRCLVGGVYVHPDYRGMGIARRMATEFTASLITEGWKVTLFVKKNNVSARRLYLRLGFQVKGDFRITYY